MIALSNLGWNVRASISVFMGQNMLARLMNQ
jgi:hypothetical protein